MARIKIKKLDEKAVIPYKSHNDDFCYDVVATSVEEIAPNVFKYGTGLSFEIDRSTIAENDSVRLSIDARPRSSIYKTGLLLSNCVGTIDEGYRGEFTCIFYRVLANMPIYKVGDRICQIKLGFTVDTEFVESDELSETERGVGGYGSTGK